MGPQGPAMEAHSRPCLTPGGPSHHREDIRRKDSTPPEAPLGQERANAENSDLL